MQFNSGINLIKLSSSESCNIEIFGINDQVLCFQGHPEFSISYMKSFADGITNIQEKSKAFKKISAKPHFSEFQKICFEFLHK